MTQLSTIGKVATTVARDSDGTLRVTYHRTNVVKVYPDGTIELNSGGWRTATTKVRMNQAANQLSLGFSVYQKAHEWFVCCDGIDGSLTFEDGMLIAPRSLS